MKHADRTVTFALDGLSGTFGQNVTRHLLTASQTLQLGPRLRTRAAFNFSPTRTEGLLPAQAGTDSPVSNFDVTGEQPNWTTLGPRGRGGDATVAGVRPRRIHILQPAQ